MATSTITRIDFKGPFFKADVNKTMLQNVHKMMTAFAAEGAGYARERLMSGSGSRAMVRELGDRVADHVVGRVMSRSGKQWTAAAVVQVYNEGLSASESVSLMAAASYVERRTHAIGSVTRQLRSARAVLQADLTKGLE